MKIQTVSDLLFYVNHDRQQLIARTTRRRQLIIAVIALALSAALVAFGQTVEIYTEKGVLTNKPAEVKTPTPTPTASPLPKFSMAEWAAKLAAEDEARKAWREPTPLPGNRDRK